MIYTLVIKGDMVTAHNACTMRGVEYTNLDETWVRGIQRETLVTTEQGVDRGVLVSWLCDGIGQAPFPDGTLLWYGPATTRKESP